MTMLEDAHVLFLWDAPSDDLVREKFEKIGVISIVMSRYRHQPQPFLARHTWRKNLSSYIINNICIPWKFGIYCK
jgi:hypothetical protein